MGQLVPVAKTNFAAGEIHPSLYPRIDTPQYAMGMKTIKNCIVFPTGGIGNRAGTEYINSVKGVGTTVRLKEFVFSSGDAYQLEFGNLYIRFYKNSAVLGAPYEVVTPYLSADLAALDFTQSADTILITSPIHQPRLLVRYADTTWTFSDYDYEDGPFMPLNFDSTATITPSATTGNIVLTAAANIFSNITGNDHASNRTLWQVNQLVGSQLVSHLFGATGSSSSIKCGGTWRIVTHATWTGTIQIEMSLDGGSTWLPIRSLVSNGTINYNTYGAEDYAQFLIRVTCTAWTSGAILVDLSSDPFLWKGVVQITQVPTGGSGASQMYSTADATVLTTLEGVVATADWAEGSWSNFRGYPRVSTFYQDRLLFGSTKTVPHTSWMSKTGIYLDFGRSSPLLGSDGITINLPSRQLNKITALVPLTNLLILTTGGEWSLVPIDGGAITPTSPGELKSHGNHGAANVEPVVVGDRALYIQNCRASLRDTGFSYESGGFLGNDLSVFSPHLFAGHKITEMAYQQIPYGILWVVRDDGALLSLTYNHAMGINAWALHDTQGLFESVSVIPGDSEDEVWFVVNRDGTRYIERMRQRSSSAMPEDQYYVDCGGMWEGDEYVITNMTKADPAVFTSVGHGLLVGEVFRIDGIVLDDETIGLPAVGMLNNFLSTVHSVTADTFILRASGVPLDSSGSGNYVSGGIAKKCVVAINGLTWLNGKKCSILADGKVHDDVVSAGSLDVGLCSYIRYGLQYVSDVEILPINLTAKESLLGRESDIPIVKVWLHASLGGKVGFDADHLQPFEWEEGSIEGLGSSNLLFVKYRDRPPFKYDLFSGNALVSLDTKTEGNRSIMIRQEDPLPMMILAIIPFVSFPGE